MTRVTATYNKISIDGCVYNVENTIKNILKYYLKNKLEAFMKIDLDRTETLADVNEQKEQEAADALALLPRTKKIKLAGSRLSLTDSSVLHAIALDLQAHSNRLEATNKVLAICMESKTCFVEQLLDKIILEKDLA